MVGIGRVLLVVLLVAAVIALLLAAALLFARTWVRYQGHNRSHTVWLGLGLLRIRLHTVGRKPNKVPAPPKPNKPLPPGADRLGAIAYVLLELLDLVRETLRVRTLQAEVRIGTSNAAYTGMLLGAGSAFAGMLYPYLEQNFRIRDCRITLDADFEADKTRWRAEAECSLRLYRLLAVLLRHRDKLMELNDLLRADKEEKA